jgi:hypothetical protein
MKTRKEIDENFKPEIIEARFEVIENEIAGVKTSLGLTPKTDAEVIAEAKIEAATYPARPPEPKYISLAEASGAVQAPPIEAPEPEPEPDP